MEFPWKVSSVLRQRITKIQLTQRRWTSPQPHAAARAGTRPRRTLLLLLPPLLRELVLPLEREAELGLLGGRNAHGRAEEAGRVGTDALGHRLGLGLGLSLRLAGSASARTRALQEERDEGRLRPRRQGPDVEGETDAWP